jgi:hypothetical protein
LPDLTRPPSGREPRVQPCRPRPRRARALREAQVRPQGRPCVRTQPRWVRIFSITGCQGTEALAFARHKRSSGPFVSGLTPQDGRNDLQFAATAVGTVLHVDVKAQLQRRLTCTQLMSQLKTCLSSRAQLMRCGRAWTVWTSHSAAESASVAGSSRSGGPCGTTSPRSLAFGASTPWFAHRGAAHFAQRSYADTKLMRCRRGCGTRAASRCMNSSGLITGCVVPSRHGVFSFSSTCPAALSWILWSDSAGRVM